MGTSATPTRAEMSHFVSGLFAARTFDDGKSLCAFLSSGGSAAKRSANAAMAGFDSERFPGRPRSRPSPRTLGSGRLKPDLRFTDERMTKPLAAHQKRMRPLLY